MRQRIEIDLSYLAFDRAVVDLPNGVTWADVREWFIKWDELHLELADGSHRVVQFQIEAEADLKHPAQVLVSDVDTGQVLGASAP